MLNVRWLVLLGIGLLPVSAVGQQFDERFTDWPLNTTIRGTIVIGHQIKQVDRLQPLLQQKPSSIAVVDAIAVEEFQQRWAFLTGSSDFTPVQLSVGATLSEWLQAESSDDEDRRLLVWQDDSMKAVATLRTLRASLRSFVQQGHTLVLLGPHGAAAADRFQRPHEPTHWRLGSDLIPDGICRFQSTAADRGNGHSLASFLKLHPRHFGFQLQPDCLLVLSGRRFRVLGDATAEFVLPQTKDLPERRQTLIAQTSTRQDPNEYLVDLTEWRRDAIDRTLARFPAAEPGVPKIDNGTLVIVGGGRMPPGIMDQFIEAAGGVEKAKLVYVPCSESETVGRRHGIVELWRRLGVQQASVLHTKDRVRANTDETFYAPLQDATGVWFGGGRQWNLADSYYGTTTHRLMKEVLRRGGVIGGSSAGASIQGRYLARATPIQNFRIMAPGYERGGLGFLSGVAIDQHFTQRGRQKDLIRLVERYPQLLGIGIDEGTAVVVQGGSAKVIGEGTVSFYDRRRNREQPHDVVLSAGERIDLATGRTTETGAADESAAAAAKESPLHPSSTR